GGGGGERPGGGWRIRWGRGRRASGGLRRRPATSWGSGECEGAGGGGGGETGTRLTWQECRSTCGTWGVGRSACEGIALVRWGYWLPILPIGAPLGPA